MKKIKKIIALALATVMMMAMSIVSFAADTQAKVTVTNLTKDATVNIYTVATIGDNNTLEVADWAKAVYPVEKADSTATDVVVTEMTASQVTALKNAFDSGVDIELPAPPQTADASGKVEFTGLKAGVYLIIASGSNATYSPMVAVAISRNDKGEYVAADVSIKAKGSGNDLTKETDDTFVYMGQELPFEITKEIPSNAKSFFVYDYTKNLSDLNGVEVNVNYGGADHKYTFTEVDATGNQFGADHKYMLDFTDIVYDVATDTFINDNAGKKLTITYKATVIDPNGFENTGSYKVNDGDEWGPPTVKGFEGDITLYKKGTDGNKLEGAKFTLTKKGNPDKVLTFTYDDAKKVYVYDKDSTNTELVTNADGVIKTVGLDEGVYQFTETEAPAGYSINEEIDAVEITPADSSVSQEIEVTDSTLIKLPFTGGTGTTIFTVLGVAIMAIAAALYFATKKRA